ncbi:MAG: hypothetical protein WCV63_07480 [Negativicutes bacterium]|jgi:type II secretory pathway component GspD/PulD (secretin)
MRLKAFLIILTVLLLLSFSLPVFAAPLYEIISVPQNKLLATNKLLDDLAAELDVEYRVYNGLTPEIVLYGEPDNIKLAKEMLAVFETPSLFNDLIKIDCSLQTISERNIRSLGVLPTTGVQAYGDLSWSSSAAMGWLFGLATLDNLATIKLQQALSNGTILISSSLTTPNGISSTLDVTESIPLESGAGSMTSTTYKDVPTNVKVTPTVIFYNREHPEQSLIRLAIHMQVSYINKASTVVDSSGRIYPFIGSRETDSVRIVRADGSPFIAAAFARDHLIHASVGIPGLKDIPGLGYLFGEQYNQYEQEYCVLRTNISFVPQNQTKPAVTSQSSTTTAEKPIPENPNVKAFVDRVMNGPDIATAASIN